VLWTRLSGRTAAGLGLFDPLGFQELLGGLTGVVVHLSIRNGFHSALCRVNGRVAVLADSIRAYRVVISFCAVFDLEVTSKLAAFSLIKSCEQDHLGGVLTEGH